MTDLQKMYLVERANGKCGHYAALRRIARQTGIDEGTIAECLKKARHADERDARAR